MSWDYIRNSTKKAIVKVNCKQINNLQIMKILFRKYFSNLSDLHGIP